MPNVIGISGQEGIALLESSGFEPGRIIHENSPDIAEGIIMDQTLEILPFQKVKE